MCCVLGDELDRTLLDMVGAHPDAIVLETSGVAEPLPIAWAVHRAPVGDAVRLAAVVTLVDACNFTASRASFAAVDAQVAYADVLLVTKAELAGEAQTAQAIAAASAIAPRALVRLGTTDEHAAWLEQVLADPVLENGPRPCPITTVTITITHDVDVDLAADPGARSISRSSKISSPSCPRATCESRGSRARSTSMAERAGSRSIASGCACRASRCPAHPTGFAGDRGVIVALGRDLREDRLAAAIAAAVV